MKDTRNRTLSEYSHSANAVAVLLGLGLGYLLVEQFEVLPSIGGMAVLLLLLAIASIKRL